VLATLLAALTVMCAMGGLIVLMPGLQLALIAAICAAVIASSTARAAITASLGFAVAVLVGPANAWFADATFPAKLVGLGPWVVAAAAAAALLREVAARKWLSPRVMVTVAVVLLVANMWVTTFDANDESVFDPVSGAPMPSFWQQLDGELPSQIAASDDASFFKVYRRMRQGQSFYPAFSAELEANPRWTSRAVTGFREPAVFWFWSLLPSAKSIVISFLVLASLAIACVTVITSGIVKMPLILPACAALASYFVYFPVQLVLFSQEAWAVFLGLGSLAAFALSVRSDRWKAWVVTSVVLAVAGTLVRETLVFLPVGGLASAFVGKERRAFRVAAWTAGWTVLVAGYAAHYVATRPYLALKPSQSQFAAGGFENVSSAITYATDMLGSAGVLAFVLVILGVIGAALLPDRSMRLFALVASVAPLVAFLFVANRAWYETTGQRINYWGATVVPLLYALVPIAFTLLPGALPRSPGVRGAHAARNRGR
jgi:hypothetical protein